MQECKLFGGNFHIYNLILEFEKYQDPTIVPAKGFPQPNRNPIEERRKLKETQVS